MSPLSDAGQTENPRRSPVIPRSRAIPRPGELEQKSPPRTTTSHPVVDLVVANTYAYMLKTHGQIDVADDSATASERADRLRRMSAAAMEQTSQATKYSRGRVLSAISECFFCCLVHVSSDRHKHLVGGEDDCSAAQLLGHPAQVGDRGQDGRLPEDGIR